LEVVWKRMTASDDIAIRRRSSSSTIEGRLVRARPEIGDSV